MLTDLVGPCMDRTAKQHYLDNDAGRPSLRRRLLALLLIPMLALVLAASAVGYLIALKYSNHVHDRDLVGEVEGLSKVMQDAHSTVALSPQAVFLIEYNPDGRAYFSVRSARYGLVSGSALPIPDSPLSPNAIAPVLYDTHIGAVPVRATSVVIPSPRDPTDHLTITLAETLNDRQDRADEILLMIVPLQLLLALLLLMLVWRGVGVGLRILDPLTRRLALRSDDLTAISGPDVPVEILPLTRTIDGLFGRLRGLMDLHEQFVIDAAHHLRTPMAGLALHAERATTCANDKDRNASLAYIRELSLRIARTSSQLLSLTRAQMPAAELIHLMQFDLGKLLPEILGAHVQRSSADGIDLGYEGIDKPVMIRGDAAAMGELVDNLVDNAMAYAGKSGTVTVGLVELEDGVTTCLSVDDDGPGVPTAALPRLGDRFFRAPGAVPGGTGLGLAIVHRIVDRHHGHIVYLKSALGGLRAEVYLPLVVLVP